MKGQEKYIGFWGYPNPKLVDFLSKKFPDAEWFDLDLDFYVQDKGILPDAYCKIIKNIINNAFFYKEKIIAIAAPIGKDKCDSGWFAAKLLKEYGFKVYESIFEDLEPKKDLKISTSDLPLDEKISKITANIIKPQDMGMIYNQIPPEFGFWGVPPNDFEILKLFPNTTHVYGWTRCVEAGTPADIELEMFVDENVPTVFYAQAFCAKTQLAKFLADKYNGLYLDVDDYASNSIKAKIEAFLRLQ